MSTEEEMIEFLPITPSATSKQSSLETSPAANPFDEETAGDRKMPLPEVLRVSFRDLWIIHDSVQY